MKTEVCVCGAKAEKIKTDLKLSNEVIKDVDAIYCPNCKEELLTTEQITAARDKNKKSIEPTITKIFEGGRLIVDSFPSKQKYEDEANRTDTPSWDVLHVDIAHDFLSTVRLYSALSHKFNSYCLSPQHKPESDELPVIFGNNLLDHLPTLSERCEQDFKDDWLMEQIGIWDNTVTKKRYLMWIDWCKNMLKQKENWMSVDGKRYNPYEGLRFHVRVEFHD